LSDGLVGVLVQGFTIGLAIAAPVGAIGVLCIRRTLADGPLAGFVSGLGAAGADASYGAVAGFGLTALSDALTAIQLELQIGGGLFLLWLGWRTLARPHAAAPSQGEGPVRRLGLARGFASTYVLTLSNPSTILSFVAIFAGLGLVGQQAVADRPDMLAAGLLVGGVFLGSAAWWLGLAWMVGRLRGRLSATAMLWIDRVSSGILMTFGVAALTAAALSG